MRISTVFYGAAIALGAAALSVVTAYIAATTVEDISQKDVTAALQANGIDWAETQVDGLQVFVTGVAPDEPQRFSALSIAGTVVDSARVIDGMTVYDNAAVELPTFRLELLRTNSGISAYGVLPAKFGTDDLVQELRQIVGNSGRISELLETANYPEPEHWTANVRFALSMIQDLDSSKITVTGDNITGDAVVQSLAQKQQLEAKWARQKPDAVTYRVGLTAPRPVVSPYIFRAVKDGANLKFDACTAQNTLSRNSIVRVAVELGFQDKPNCQIALGRPTDDWADMVETALRSVASFDKATITITDTDVKLIADETTPKDQFDANVAALKSALSPEYSLTAVLPSATSTDVEIPDFTISKSDQGIVQIRGNVKTDVALNMVRTVAAARFGADQTNVFVKVRDDLPVDWMPQILAGLETASMLNSGSVVIGPQIVTVSGAANRDGANSQITAAFNKTAISQSLKMNVSYTAPKVEEPTSPKATECLEEVNALLEKRKINFEPGSDRVDTDGRKLLDDIAKVLLECGDVPLEIAGHTDSQGREEMNRQLSQSRADAVLSELQRRKVLTTNFVAKGYGESRPIASNETQEGRDKNRRIEFNLIDKHAKKSDDPQLEEAQPNEQN